MGDKDSNEILDLDKLEGRKTLAIVESARTNAAEQLKTLAETLAPSVRQIQQLQELANPSPTIRDVMEKIGSFVISTRDTQKALIEAMQPSLKMTETIGSVIKSHADEFVRLADIANTIGSQWKDALSGMDLQVKSNWSEQLAQLAEGTEPSFPLLREGYLSVVGDMPLSPFGVIEVDLQPAPRRPATPTKLCEEDKEDIATRAAHKVIEQIRAGLIDEHEAVQMARREITMGIIVDNHELPTNRLCWKDLTIDLNKATLRYKNRAPIEISPETQAIKWLICIMQKQGEVATHVDLALAIGFISSVQIQSKRNQDVARNVQLIKKQVVLLLSEAGMTSDEIDETIVSKRSIGFVLR